jgi:hypothetical protein
MKQARWSIAGPSVGEKQDLHKAVGLGRMGLVAALPAAAMQAQSWQHQQEQQRH